MSALDTFQALIAPQDPHAFLEEHWGERPLRIPGTPEKAARWQVPVEEIEALLDRTRALPPVERPWRLVGPDNRIADIGADRDLHSMVADGSTICFDDIEGHLPSLGRLAADMKLALNHPGRVFISAYASGHGGGFGHHFDYHTTFILQLAGRKHWQVGRQPAVAWPPVIIANERNARDASLRYPWMQVTHPSTGGQLDMMDEVLEPGDVLYLPAGTWHRARTQDKLSIALSIACVPFNAADLVEDYLRGTLGPNERWRASIPPALAGYCQPDRLPPEVERFLEERLTELRATVGRLTPADLYAAWAEQIAALSPGITGPEHVELSIGIDDKLRLADDALLRYVSDAGGLRLYHRDVRIVLDPSALPIVAQLAAHPDFRAGDATTWGGTHDWEDVAAVLSALLHAGVLLRTTPAPRS